MNVQQNAIFESSLTTRHGFKNIIVNTINDTYPLHVWVKVTFNLVCGLVFDSRIITCSIVYNHAKKDREAI